MDCPASKMKTQNRDFARNRELIFKSGNWSFERRVKFLSSIVFFTVNQTENEKFGCLRLTGPILKNEIGFFRRSLSLGGFWNRNQEFESRPKTGFRNLESGNFEQGNVDWINLTTKIKNSRFGEPETNFDEFGRLNPVNWRDQKSGWIFWKLRPESWTRLIIVRFLVDLRLESIKVKNHNPEIESTENQGIQIS